MATVPPTRLPAAYAEGIAQQTTLHVPGTVMQLGLAVHPTEAWPALIGVEVFSVSTEPWRVFVQVMDPATRRWRHGQQLDVGAASIGRDRNIGAAIAIGGDGTIVAVWGNGDELTSPPDPGSLFVSESTDGGATWSEPTPIARGCLRPTSIAASLDGQFVVLAACGFPSRATLIVRDRAGTWEPAARVGGESSGGAVVIVGSGEEARAVAMTTSFVSGAGAGGYKDLTILSKRLASSEPWQVTELPYVLPDGTRPTDRMPWHHLGLVFGAPNADGTLTDHVLFTWTTFAGYDAFALHSLDGGATWAPLEPIVYAPDEQEQRVPYLAPAYDAAANRLIAIWTCCARTHGTHYASWSVPGSGVWSPSEVPGRSAPLVPLVSGGRRADVTVSAQATNRRQVWLAWVEDEHQVVLRTLDLDLIVPRYAYPTRTPEPKGVPSLAPVGGA
jgi:hypothetical protein